MFAGYHTWTCCLLSAMFAHCDRGFALTSAKVRAAWLCFNNYAHRWWLGCCWCSRCWWWWSSFCPFCPTSSSFLPFTSFVLSVLLLSFKLALIYICAVHVHICALIIFLIVPPTRFPEHLSLKHTMCWDVGVCFCVHAAKPSSGINLYLQGHLTADNMYVNVLFVNS